MCGDLSACAAHVSLQRAALERVAALEAECARMAQDADRRGANLAQSRAFIRSYLQARPMTNSHQCPTESPHAPDGSCMRGMHATHAQAAMMATSKRRVK